MKTVNISVALEKSSPIKIQIGRQGENRATKVIFDCSVYTESFGIGTAYLFHQRAPDTCPYPVAIEQDGNTIMWEVSASDTQFAGQGQCELFWYVDDVIAKTQVWGTTVTEALTGTESEEVPEAAQGWVSKVLQAIADIGKVNDEVVKAAVAAYIAENGLPDTGGVGFTSWSYDTDTGYIHLYNEDGEEAIEPLYAPGLGFADLTEDELQQVNTILTRASNYAAQAGQAKEAASASAENATKSAQDAATSAERATQSASAAATSETNASQSASSAAADADLAKQYNDSALKAAGEAAQSLSGAQDAAETAQEAAQDAIAARDGFKVDTTLSQSGQAADAKAVGDALSSLSDEIGNGLTTAQINALDGMFKVALYDDTKDYSGAYQAFKNAFGLNVTIPATGIMLSASALSFTETGSKMLIATVEPSDTTDKVVWTTSAPGVATVVNGLVTPVADGDCIITATAGSVSASCNVSVAFAEEVTYCTITNNLTNCASNNSAASIVEGGSYTAILTADEGYTLAGASVSVVVNGEDVTDTAYADGVITIQSVTGNVVITVVAVEVGADDGDEVVMLKSITGDGESWIDTDVLPEISHRYELSATLTGTTPEFFVGCDMANVGGSYGSFYVNTQDTVCIAGCLNRNTFTNVGTWNKAEANLLTNKQAYFVIKSGMQAVYLDAAYTTQQTNKTDGTVVWGSGVNTEVPIIPIYLFRLNYNAQTNPGNAKNYTPTTTKIFWFRIFDDASNTLLHEFVPAKQGGSIGMYDTVTGKFHANIGTGTFGYEEVA